MNYPRNFFLYPNFLRLLGCMYDSKNWTYIPRLLYKCWISLVYFICQVYYLPAELFAFSTVVNDLKPLLEHTGMVLIHTLGFIKTLLLTFYMKNITRTFEILEDPQYRYESSEDYKPNEEVAFAKKISDRLVMIFITLGSFVPLSRFIGSKIELYLKGNLIDTGEKTCSQFLPFYAWQPLPIETREQCGRAAAFQSVAPYLALYQNIGADMTVSSILLYLRAHLKNIRGAMRTIRQRCITRLELPKDYETFVDSENPALTNEIKMEVRKISTHLQVMLSLMDEIEKMFNGLFLGQMLTTLFVLVTCLYMLSTTSNEVAVFLSQMEYVVSLLIQFGMFCVLSTEMTDACAEIADGIWEFDWLSCNHDIKSTMMIHLIKLQRPVHLSIGKFSALNLSTFVSVVKGSYSYYTVLN